MSRIALVGVVFGVLAFLLVAIDKFEYQFICGVLAVLFSGYSIVKSKSKIAFIGLALGLLFLCSVGLLWLVWPK